MKIFDASLSLLEIENLLEEVMELEVSDSYNSDTEEELLMNNLELTYEDYRYLMFKLKGIVKYRNSIDIIGRYKLSILAAVIFSIKNGDREETYQLMKEAFFSLPQHQIRKLLNICREAFDEYAIHSFGLDLNSFDGVFSALSIHAGAVQEYSISYVG